MNNDTTTVTSIENHLRTVRTRQAIRASVERDGDTPSGLELERDYWRWHHARQLEASLRARKSARAWRTAYLLTAAAALVLAGGWWANTVMVAAGVVLVCAGVLSGHQEV